MISSYLPNPSSVPHLRELFAHEADRFQKFSHTACGILFDFSKQRVTQPVLDALVTLAKTKNLESWRDRMFAGDIINTSENRAVLHTVLRAQKDHDVRVNGEKVWDDVQATKERFLNFADDIRSNKIKSSTGDVFTDVINIGIGGSDLGPRMVEKALYNGTLPRIHFVSNVDASSIDHVLKLCDPKTTLIVIASKTFTTIETMMNANTARTWLETHLGKDAMAQHGVALSTNIKAVQDFGISPDRMFPFSDWVGGRYSLWSSIGLSIALSCGREVFENLLRGAAAMDDHFRTTPLNQNIPVLMGLIGVWNRNSLDCPSHMILPYDDRLSLFVKHIQQVDMESNGKTVMRDGATSPDKTGPQIFGEPGTDSQHSFMQLVHQGSDIIPVDFIAATKPGHTHFHHHAELLSNMLAQSRALAFGQTLEEAKGDASRVFDGNRPSTTILLPFLDAYSLGALIAAYEHKVFVQGIIWGLNSFDQPGVELGKILAKPISNALQSKTRLDGVDGSTAGLINLILK